MHDLIKESADGALRSSITEQMYFSEAKMGLKSEQCQTLLKSMPTRKSKLFRKMIKEFGDFIQERGNGRQIETVAIDFIENYLSRSRLMKRSVIIKKFYILRELVERIYGIRLKMEKKSELMMKFGESGKNIFYNSEQIIKIRNELI